MGKYLESLPASWEVSSLGEVSSQPQYGYTTSGSAEGSLKLLRTTDITSGAINWDAVPFCLENPQDSEKYLLEDGDIVISRAGSVGISHVLKNPPRAVFASYLIRFKPFLNIQYFRYFLLSPYYWVAIEGNKLGIAVPNVNASKLREIPIPIPPEAEQHRIVAKIEELFSELDQGVASLKAAREQLRVYRQSLLKNAFEGKLTAAWRAAHADQLETATALQQRIARERQARYQQQLADWQTAGQAGPKPKPPKPLSPLTAEELAELPELPEGWGWVKLGALIDDPAYGTSQKCDYETAGVGVLRIPNVVSGKIDATDLKFAQFSPEEIAAYQLAAGDLLMIRSNGSVSIVGKCALVSQQDTAHLYAGYLIRLRPLQTVVLPAYLAQLLLAHELRKQIEHKAKSTSGVNNINSGEIQTLVVPFCGLSEQELILQELESKLSEADQLDQTLATALQQADALRQSILKKAFCGQLVAQDKNDEPATALLERIRAAKSASGKGKPRRIAPLQPEILELTASPGQVIPFPVPLPGIAAKDLQAGILAMAYRLHEPHPEKLEHFGHVKAEKICHLVEAHLGFDLERQPVKEAAGPNDHPHLKRVEHRARLANWFEVTRLDSGKYVFHPKPGFSRLLDKTRRVLGARLGEVERLLELMLPMTMRQAEILATLYAAWNNLLLLGKSPNDEEIVTEARENWHEEKLKIERDRFFTALAWMRGKGLVPSGRGRFVKAKGEV